MRRNSASENRLGRVLRRSIPVLAGSLAAALLIAPAASANGTAPRSSSRTSSSPKAANSDTPDPHERYADFRTAALRHSRPSERTPAPTVPADAPFGVAIDHRTGSVYVANWTGVVVFDGAACNSLNPSGCSITPITVPAGYGGIGIVVDEPSNTIYVTNAADSAVSVIDGDTCNAHVTSGCATPHPAVPVGPLPSHLAIDHQFHTLYVSNEGFDAPGNTMSMIDIATCNGHTTAGCQATPPTAATGLGPDGLVVDAKTHTLYVSDGADQTVSVIDTSTCNATQAAGCLAVAPVVVLAGYPVGGALDPITGSLLVPTDSPTGGPDIAGTLSMINTARCNASMLSGCALAPNTTSTGSGPIDVAVNGTTRRAYVVNEEDSDVSVIDLTHCNAGRTDGCRQNSPTMDIGFDGGAVAVDASTNTIYASSQQEGTVTVLDGRTCNGSATTGCRHPAPTTGLGLGAAGGAFDHSNNTLYVANQLANTVSVVDPTGCNAIKVSGCRTDWPTIAVGEFPKAVAVDETLDTLYTANYTASTVSVVDLRACNAHVATGCGQTVRTINVIGGAYTVSLDPVTHTVYVANVDSDTVTAIDASTCNAHIDTGCGSTPFAIHTGNTPAAVLVDPGTRTLYVSNRGDNTVSLLDLDTCNGTVTVGCMAVPPTVLITAAPRFLAVDDTTGTLFVSTRDNSTVALVDTATCNAHVTTGCASPPPVVKVGFLPYGIVADPATGRVFVGNIGDSTVTAFDGRTCNAHSVSGCTRTMRTFDTGGWPTNLTLDDRNGTLYVSDNVDAAASIIGTDRER